MSFFLKKIGAFSLQKISQFICSETPFFHFSNVCIQIFFLLFDHHLYVSFKISAAIRFTHIGFLNSLFNTLLVALSATHCKADF